MPIRWKLFLAGPGINWAFFLCGALSVYLTPWWAFLPTAFTVFGLINLFHPRRLS